MQCTVDGCLAVASVRSMCGFHYGRARATGQLLIGEGWHRIVDLNLQAMTATCSICGDVGVVTKNRDKQRPRYRCRNKVREEKQRSPNSARRLVALRAAYKASPENARVTRRRTTLRKYGLDEQAFRLMAERQNERCALCGDVDPLVVDHDHDTGTVRDLLCSTCNTALGMAGDDPSLLRRMAEYVERHRSAAA